MLFELFVDYLLHNGVSKEHIIALRLDDDINEKFRDPKKLSEFVREKTSDPDDKYYVLLDEIQYAISKEELTNKDVPARLYSVLNGFFESEEHRCICYRF